MKVLINFFFFSGSKVLETGTSSMEGDIYSFGLTLLYSLYPRVAYKDLPHDIPPDLKDLLSKLLDPNPLDRLTAA